MDPSFNMEEFAFPDKDYSVVLQIIYNKPIPPQVQLMEGQQWMLNFVEPARRGIFFVDSVEDHSLRVASQQGPNLRICMWPSKRVVLKEGEVAKVARDLMRDEGHWDDRLGWLIAGSEGDQRGIEAIVLQKLRRRYQCVPTDKVSGVLRAGGYYEQPTAAAAAAANAPTGPPRPTHAELKASRGPRESDYHDSSDPEYAEDSDYGRKKKKKGRPKGSKNRSDSQPGKKFKSEKASQKSAKSRRMATELSSKGGPMSDKIYGYLMTALETGDVKEGMPEEHIKDYERCWVKLNDKLLPYRCFDGIGSGQGWWGIWHRSTNRLVVRLSETKNLIYTIMDVLKTKSVPRIFEYQRTRYCLTRDRIRDFIDDWGVYKSSDDDSDLDAGPRTTMPGRPANRFLAMHGGGAPGTSSDSPMMPRGEPVEIEHDHISLPDSGDDREKELAKEEARAAKGSGKGRPKKKAKASVQPRKADDRAKYPMAAVQIDCVSTQNASYASKSYGYILVVRCVFSGYVFARAIPDMERGLLCRHLMDIFGNFGPPKGYFTTDTTDVVKNCAQDVEGLFRVQMKPFGKTPPNTHPKLLKMFRDRCYEKAMESFGDQRRWVEILPYTVMEFNQRLREGDVLTPFEVMFSREPWEGVDPAPWVVSSEGSKAPEGFVATSASYFARIEHTKDEMRLFTKIQADVRRRGQGLRPVDCKTVRVGTDAPFPPPCQACKASKAELKTAQKTVKALEKEVAKLKRGPAPPKADKHLDGGYWGKETPSGGRRAKDAALSTVGSRRSAAKRPRRVHGGTDTDDSSSDDSEDDMPLSSRKSAKLSNGGSARRGGPGRPRGDGTPARARTPKQHFNNGINWVPLKLHRAQANALPSPALGAKIAASVVADCVEAVTENVDAEFPEADAPYSYYKAALVNGDFDDAMGDAYDSWNIDDEAKRIIFHPLTDQWFLPCQIGPLGRLSEAEVSLGMERHRERRRKAQEEWRAVKGTRRAKDFARDGWAHEVEEAMLEEPETVTLKEDSAEAMDTGERRASVVGVLSGTSPRGSSETRSEERRKLCEGPPVGGQAEEELTARLSTPANAPASHGPKEPKQPKEEPPSGGLTALQAEEELTARLSSPANAPASHGPKEPKQPKEEPPSGGLTALQAEEELTARLSSPANAPASHGPKEPKQPKEEPPSGGLTALQAEEELTARLSSPANAPASHGPKEPKQPKYGDLRVLVLVCIDKCSRAGKEAAGGAAQLMRRT